LQTVLLTVAALVGVPASARAQLPANSLDALGPLQRAYNSALYEGVAALRRTGPDRLPGDNTDPNGMRWSKCADLGLDLLDTLVGEDRGLVSGAAARDHVARVLEGLRGLEMHAGIFPEFIRFDGGGGAHAEIKEGRIRYSSIDSAWVTVALSLVEARYRGSDETLAGRARTLIDAQDYGVFVDAKGTMGAGFWVDANTQVVVQSDGFSYDDLNSEARPLVNALVGLGKLPDAAWTGLRYAWVREEGVAVARGWHWSAFVEMTGQLFLDEASLAPGSLGRSHAGYLEANLRVARREGHVIFGYAPACEAPAGYTEYGLDHPSVVAPYAAAELATTGDPRAVENLRRVLAAIPPGARPAPDALEPATANLYCAVARTLDQSLLFLSLNVDALWRITKRARWYASAERRIRALDQTAHPPVELGADDHAKTGAPDVPEDASSPQTVPPMLLRPAERAAAIERARVRLRSVIAAIARAERAAGGRAGALRATAGMASARALAAWTSVLPSASLFARWQNEISPSAGGAIGWIDLQAQTVFSLERAQAGWAEGKDADVAAAAARRAEAEALLDGLRAYLDIYLAERRADRLRAHERALGTLVSGLERVGGRGDDLLAVEARLQAVRAVLVQAEGDEQVALARLGARTGQAMAASDLDAHLDLDDVLRLLESAVPVAASAADEANAEVQSARAWAQVAESGGAYAPELRLRLLDRWVRSPSDGDRGGKRVWSTDWTLGEAMVSVAWRPEASALSRTRRAELEASGWRRRAVGEAEALARGQALARRDGARSAWASTAGVLAAQATFEKAASRFARGEVDGAALVDASKTWVSDVQYVEGLFADAVRAELDVALGASSERGADGQEAPEPEGSGVKAAEAEVEAAQAESEAARWNFDTRLEAGVLYPLFVGDSPGVTATPGPLTASGAPAPLPVRETALLERVSLSDRLGSREREVRAARATLVQSHAILARGAHRAALAQARVAVAYATEVRRLAEARSEYAVNLERDLRRWRDQGLVSEETLAVEGERRRAEAAADRDVAHAHEREATLRQRALLAPGDESAPIGGEGAEATASQVADVLYPSEGLVGFEAKGRLRVAALEARLARARLSAAVSEGPGVHVELWASEGLASKSFSIGLGLSWELDPRARAYDVVDARRAAAVADQRLAATPAAIDLERRWAVASLHEAERARDAERAGRDGIRAILQRAREEQASQPEVHDSLKLRTISNLEELTADSQRRVLLSEQRMADARLRALALGANEAASDVPTKASATPVASSLRQSIEQWIATDPSVRAADAGALGAGDGPVRPPLVGAAHAAGPYVVVSFDQEAAGATRELASRAVTGDVGAGLSFALDDALSFLGGASQARAAELRARAVRQRARLEAILAMAAQWSALQSARLQSTRQDMHARAQRVAEPRFRAGDIGPERLAQELAAGARTRAEFAHAEGTLERSRTAMEARGVSVPAEALEEFGRYVAGDEGTASERVLQALETPEPGDPTVQAAAVERSGAWTQGGLALLRLADPVTALVEFQPTGQYATGGARPLARDARWGVALGGGLDLRAIGDVIEASARVAARQGEVELAERQVGATRVEARARLAACSASWHAAREQLDAARAAFESTDRRYRDGDPWVSVDAREDALDDFFEAQDNELSTRSALLVARARFDFAMPDGPTPP
jgi:hypothetical protein